MGSGEAEVAARKTEAEAFTHCSMNSDELIAEVRSYKAVLEGILSRFSGTHDAINIRRADEPVYRQKIIEICDLLNDALGPNSYSSRIRDRYNQGIANFLRSPSYQSVQDIIGVLGAVMTRLKRSPEIIRRSGKSNETGKLPSKRVFIGHGHSLIWKDIKDFLVDRLQLDYVEFNREPSAGKSNKERLQEMLSTSGFALIVMTGEDEAGDGKLRARENVVHEAGLFQGRLGFERAIILREKGCEEFSNIEGLIQVLFPRGNIMAVSEEIRRTLEREGLIPKSSK